MQRHSPFLSARLDWAILMCESTRGHRRMYWRVAKWFWEIWVGIENRTIFIEIKVYDGAVRNNIHFCTSPLIAIYGTPDRCYMHVKQAGALYFERGHSLSFDLALARVSW